MAGEEGSAGSEGLATPPGCQKFWVKGESSGNVQHVRDLRVDCDGDCLLLKVEQTGAACHEGYRTCFFRATTPEGAAESEGEEVHDVCTQAPHGSGHRADRGAVSGGARRKRVRMGRRRA